MRTLLTAIVAAFLISGLTGFPSVAPIASVLAQESEFLVQDGLRLPLSHIYELYNPDTRSSVRVSVDTVPRHVRQGSLIYDRTAAAWVSHPSVGNPNPQYVASGREFRREDRAEQSTDILVLDGLQLPRSHRYELYDPRTGNYGIVAVDTVPRHVRAGNSIYDRTADTWVSHPTVGHPNPQYVASGREFRREDRGEEGRDVLIHEGLRLPRSHRYELYVPATASYGIVTIDTVPRYVRQGSWIYDRTADAWVSHPSVGQPNPQYVALGRDSRRSRLLGEREVDFRADRDVIEVGRDEARFEKIRVVVLGAPIQIRDMKVVFDDDSVFDPVDRDRVLREDSAYVFDLPGQRRRIKQISFLYRSIDRREGKATVQVYGEQERDGRRDSPREGLLGELEVDFRADRDVIEVGRDEGRFQKIRLVVRGAPIQLHDMKVVFEDDTVFDPVIRDQILREDSAYVFDLPGQRRIIKRITFQYRSIDRREGKATVQVYGEH